MAHHPPPERLQFQRIRVAAVVIESGRVLLVDHQFPDQSRAYLLPGGGVELGETLVQSPSQSNQP
jgi:ADP-ribose pyrophosphatase YjhB (NUDIX family)